MPKKTNRVKVTMPRSFENKYDNASTRRSGEKALAYIYKLLDMKPDDDVKESVKRSDELIKLLDASTVKASTKDSYLGYYFMILKCEGLSIPKKLKSYSTIIKNNKKKKVDAKPKGKAAAKIKSMSLNSVYDWAKSKMNNKSKKTYLTTSQRVLLLSFLKNNPHRLKELTNMKYTKWEGNYVDIDSKLIYINKHKGKQDREPIEMSDELVEDLKAHQKAFPYEYVFIVNRKPYGNVPMKSEALTKLFVNVYKSYQRIVLKRDEKDVVYVGARDVRKLHVSDAMTGAGITPEMMEKYKAIQKKLGHNANNTLLDYYY